MERAHAAAAERRAALATADPSDYVALGALQAEVARFEAEAAELEEQWLEVAAQLEG